MRATILVCLFLSTIIATAQKFSESFNPVVKTTPNDLNIVQSADDSYFVFGTIDYYDAARSGSLLKVDQKGKLVPGFQKVFTDEVISTIVELPSGKIIIHGKFKYLNGIRTGNVALLNADGTVDTHFKTALDKSIRTIVVQSTGKIVTILDVANSNIMQVKRLNVDGSLDNTFTSSLAVAIYNAVLGENDKIYVGNNSMIYRLLAGGDIDYTYSFESDQSKAIGIFKRQPDGKLVVSIGKAVSTSPVRVEHSVERFNMNGTKDNSFFASSATHHVEDIAIRKNGKIAITGLFTSFDSQPGEAVELNSDGSTNRSLLTTDFNGMYSIYEDRQENLFIAGGYRKANGFEQVEFITKIKPDYSVDLSFKLPVTQIAGWSLNVPIAVQSNSKMVVGGDFYFSGVEKDSLKISRTLADGSQDLTFKPQVKNVQIGLNTTYVRSIGVQHDDKLVVGGSDIFATSSPSLGRLLPDGQLDNSFQIGSGPANTNNFRPIVSHVLIKGSKIYILGFFDKFNGTPCQSFVILDQNGKKIGPEKSWQLSSYFFTDIEVQSDGKVILMGETQLSPGDSRDFVRLNPDGSIDDTFLLKKVGGSALDFDIDAEDNILVTGRNLNNTIGKIIAKFSSDGSIDNTFNLGATFTSPSFLSGYFVKALDNDLIAIGGRFTHHASIFSPALVILNKEGSLVPMNNPFDSTSLALKGSYKNGILYMMGRFSKKGVDLNTGVKVLFPIEQNISNYLVKATSDSTVQLTWTGSFTGSDRIVVEKSSPDTSAFQLETTISPNLQSYTVQKLKEVTPYYFRIKGENEFYSSLYLDGKDTTFIAPQIALPATDITPGSFVANWQYLPGTDSVLLQVGSRNFSEFVNGYDNVIVKEGSKSIVGLEEGKSYDYRVKRFKNKRSSGFSETVIVNVITEIEKSPLKVNVYPNPVSDYLSIDLPENITNADLVIHSATGAIVGKYSFTGKASSKIDLRNLPQGVFILTLSARGMNKKYKLVRSE